MKSDAFPDRSLFDRFYSHNLTSLLRAADLEEDVTRDPPISSPRRLASTWSEQSRYTTGKGEKDAKELFDGITNKVLPWIKARW